MILRQTSCNPVRGDKEVSGIPEKGIQRYCFLLYSNFFKLVRLNLLYIFFCIPIITIPAASGGMVRVLVKLIDTGQCFIFSDFYEEFKLNFLRYSSFGLMSAAVFFPLYLLAAYCIVADYNLFMLIGLLISMLGFILIILMNLYAYTLTALVKLKFFQILKNALLLSLVALRRNMLLLAGVALMIVTLYYLFPFSIVGIVLIAFSMTVLAICQTVIIPIAKYIIDPYEPKASRL